MNDSSQHELLSAYLDGELTADEQVQVERLLADDPRAKRLLDELRALSATLQSLPQRKLGENLSQQVLRLAERRKREAEAELPRPAAPAEPPRWRRMLSRRALTWTALTVAVAVVIVFNEPRHPQPHKPVAVAPREDGAEQKTGAKPGPAPEMRAIGGVVEKAKKQAEAVASASPKQDAFKVADAEGLAAGSAAASAPDKPATAGGKSSGPAIAKFYADGKPIVLPKDEKVAEAGKTAQGDGDALVVVVCDVSAEAAEKHVFRKLLAQNHIAWAEPPHDAKDSAAMDAENVAGKSAAKSLERAAENRDRGTAGRDLRLTEDLAKAGAAELVEVRATRAQINATLDQLAALPEQFLSVSIETGARAETAGRWNREQRKAGVAATKLGKESPAAKREALRERESSAADRADAPEEREGKAVKESGGSDKLVQRGIARRVTRLDALDDAPSFGGRSAAPGRDGQGTSPAEQPAPAGNPANGTVALPLLPARPGSAPEPAKKPPSSAAPVADNAPRAEGVEPKAEPAPPAPPKPVAPVLAAEPRPVEKKTPAGAAEESVAEKQLEGGVLRSGLAFGARPGEKRDASPAVDSTSRYAEGRKALDAERLLEPTCRVLFVLRVAPTQAAASLREAAPKAEADAARETPAAKSK